MLNDRPLVIVTPKAGGGFDEGKSARYVGALSTGLVGMLIYSGTDRFRKAAESHRKQRLSRLRMDSRP